MSDTVVDARGLKCPLPVLKLEKALAGTGVGKRLAVLATDPMARIDIALYCRQHGHELTMSDEGPVTRFEIIKAQSAG